MQKDVKNYLVGLLTGSHRHESMTDASKCADCGYRFKKAEAVYNRLRRENPEKFTRPEEGFGREVENVGQMLEDRLRKDKEYKEHLRLLAFGTPEQKKREVKKAQSGYFQKHSSYETAKIYL